MGPYTTFLRMQEGSWPGFVVAGRFSLVLLDVVVYGFQGWFCLLSKRFRFTVDGLNPASPYGPSTNGNYGILLIRAMQDLYHQP